MGLVPVTTRIDRFLTQMRHIGVFEKIKALVVGRFHPLVGFGEDNKFLKEILLRATRDYDCPIVYDADFGHTDPMMILANGINASLEAKENGDVSFRMLEVAVD